MSSGRSGLPMAMPSFPCLSHLSIKCCPQLSCIPLCPPSHLEKLKLNHFNEKLRIIERVGPSCHPSLLKLEICDVNHLNWGLPMQAFNCLRELNISSNRKLERLEEVGEVFRSCSSSLRSLYIRNCSKLRSLRGGLEHLTALENLEIWFCEELEVNEEEGDGAEDERGIPCLWQPLHHCLRQLILWDLPKLVNLPEGMQHLTSLQTLHITQCEALESIPKWMPKLTAVTRLVVDNCSTALKRRCSDNPPGEDWLNIQHIPKIEIRRW